MGKNDSHDLFRELLYSKVTCASADTVKKKDIKSPFFDTEYIYCFIFLLFFIIIIRVIVKMKSDIGQLIKRAFQGSAVS